MKSIHTLLVSDYWELRRWFQKETASKLFVAVGFMLIVVITATVLYTGTNIFFRYLSRYETYGLVSANYLFHAGFIILFGLITLLSSVSFCTFLYSSRRKMYGLLVLPLSPYAIPGWLFFREMLVTLLLFLFFLTPFFISFYQYFVQTDGMSYTLIYLSVVFILATITPLFGMGLGLLFCIGFQKNKKITLGVLLILAILSANMLMRLIFPVELKKLYNATPEQFEKTYAALPLNNPYLPTASLVKGVTEGNIVYVLPFLPATFLLLILIGQFASRNFTHVYCRLFDRPFHTSTYQRFDKRLVTIKWPLMYKDLLGIIRVPQEGGYGLFLICLTFVFFLFILFARQFRAETYEGGGIVLVFYFIAFLFYTIAYTLRMIFPLMAKEGRATWHIFSLPLAPKTILYNKLLASICFIVPYIVGSFALWMLVSADGIFLSLYSLLVILSIVVAAVALGAIHPNFAESENAEKISTSGMGILTLFFSLFIVGVGSFSLYLYISALQSVWLLFLPIVLLFFGVILLYQQAEHAVDRYQF